MFKKVTLAAAIFFAMGMAPQAAHAQYLISQGADLDADFNSFESGLDRQSSEMSNLRMRERRNAAQVNLINQQANQDTENSAEQQFQNGQEQMINSGGAYNNQGFMWGGGFGGMGWASPWGQSSMY